MKDLIMKLLGYENINKIKIPEDYKRPRATKLQRKKEIYHTYKVLSEIIINEKNILIDGFCSYYLAKVWNIKYVKTRKVYNQKIYKTLWKI